MNAPQIIWIVLMSFSLGCNLMHHGQPKTGKYDIKWVLVTVIIHAALLWWGGFFGGGR